MQANTHTLLLLSLQDILAAMSSIHKGPYPQAMNPNKTFLPHTAMNLVTATRNITDATGNLRGFLLRLLFGAHCSGCHVSHGEAWECSKRGNTLGLNIQLGEIPQLRIENFPLRLSRLYLPPSHSSNRGLFCFSSVVNPAADCMGGKTGTLCRKLLFSFYFTKPKAERMLHGALQW